MRDLNQRFFEARTFASVIVAFVAALIVSMAATRVAADTKRPNLVVMMGDNLGAWQLGCYGNPDIRTPNLDQLAADGLRFTRAMCCNPVCSPTRASFLTGLIPSQHGVHHWLQDENLQIGPNARCVISQFETLPGVLNANGYHCGLVGKWHLGGNATPQIGFDEWVTMPSGLTRTFYDCQVIENGTTRTQPGNIMDFWTDRAIGFLERAETNPEEPFYLQVMFNGPYSLDPELLITHRERARNRHTANYADNPMASFVRQKPHNGLFKHTIELNQVEAMRTSGALISGLDDCVGRIVATLERLELAQDTLIVFCADQGLAGGRNGIWGMGHNAKPSVAYDSVMQVPLIVSRPESVPAGETSNLIVNNYDMLPTILDYVGLDDEIPTKSPGRSFAPTLNGQQQNWENVTFYEHFYTRAIRTDRWKYVFRHEQPDDLFDLANDPEEQQNLADRAEHRTVQRELKQRLDEFFNHYADPQYDIVQGGTSQSWRPPFVDPSFVLVPGKTRYYEYEKK